MRKLQVGIALETPLNHGREPLRKSLGALEPAIVVKKKRFYLELRRKENITNGEQEARVKMKKEIH